MHSALIVLVLTISLAVSACAAPSTAHSGGKSKANVSPVCSASKTAWSSTSACNKFKDGICDTVPTCPALCPYLTSPDGCNLVDRAEAGQIEVTNYIVSDLDYDPATDTCTPSGESFTDAEVVEPVECYGLPENLVAIIECPPGTIALQPSCIGYFYTEAGVTPSGFGATAVAGIGPTVICAWRLDPSSPLIPVRAMVRAACSPAKMSTAAKSASESSTRDVLRLLRLSNGASVAARRP